MTKPRHKSPKQPQRHIIVRAVRKEPPDYDKLVRALLQPDLEKREVHLREMRALLARFEARHGKPDSEQS